MAKLFVYLIGGFILITGSFGISTSAYAVDKYSVVENPAQKGRITPKELKKLIDSKENLIIVDVRSSDAYQNLHIKGAISVPLNKVATVLGNLPVETTIVFY